MKQYELCYIISDEVSEKEADLVSQNIKKMIEDLGGKIVVEDIWGRKKLAYPIDGQGYGFYIFKQIELEPDKITKLESNLKLTKEIIRHLISVLEPVKEIGIKKEKLTKGERVSKVSRVSEVSEEVKVKKITKPIKKAEKKVKVKEVRIPKAPKKPKLAAEEKAEEVRMAQLDEKLKEILKE